MAKADAVEVDFSGGERSGTRWANSTITANLVQYDQQLSGHRAAAAAGPARRPPVEFDDDSLKAMVAEATRPPTTPGRARRRCRPSHGPQDYIPVDAALPPMVNFGPANAREMVRKSIDVCDKKGALGSGYIPKNYQTTCSANSKGLFAYYQYAEAGLILTCRTPDGSGSGWAGITGVKDIEPDRPGAPDGGRLRQGGQEPEAAGARAGPLHGDSRTAARRAVPVAHDRHLQRTDGREPVARSYLTAEQESRHAPRSARKSSAISSRSRATSAIRSCARRRSSPTACRPSR